VHNFPYHARVNWPRPEHQINWIDQLETIEGWLNATIGPEYKLWRWVGEAEFATVAFKLDKHKTLFLLTW
jgi:hypothetical protein